MIETWKEAVHRQRVALAERLSHPLADLAAKCEPVFGDREKLNKVLTDDFSTVPNGLFMYVLDTSGVQLSDNVSAEGLLKEHFGRDPFMPPYFTIQVGGFKGGEMVNYGTLQYGTWTEWTRWTHS